MLRTGSVRTETVEMRDERAVILYRYFVAQDNRFECMMDCHIGTVISFVQLTVGGVRRKTREKASILSIIPM